MGRGITFAYGLASYCAFLGTILYTIGFVSGFGVPKTIDTGQAAPLSEALIVNILLLSVFTVQHSVMARKPFKKWLTQFIPSVVERSTYVLLSSLALILLFWQWRPITHVVWHMSEPTLAIVLFGLSLFGWLLVFASTFLISHLELFGLRQVLLNLTGQRQAEPQFRTPMLYKIVRHPLYLGFVIAMWATPLMTAGHLLFAVGATAYILVGIALEERDLSELFGDEYNHYRQRVPMLVPLLRKHDMDKATAIHRTNSEIC